MKKKSFDRLLIVVASSAVHGILRIFLEHHISRASIHFLSLTVIVHVSTPYKNIGKISARTTLIFLTSVISQSLQIIFCILYIVSFVKKSPSPLEPSYLLYREKNNTLSWLGTYRVQISTTNSRKKLLDAVGGNHSKKY